MTTESVPLRLGRFRRVEVLYRDPAFNRTGRPACGDDVVVERVRTGIAVVSVITPKIGWPFEREHERTLTVGHDGDTPRHKLQRALPLLTRGLEVPDVIHVDLPIGHRDDEGMGRRCVGEGVDLGRKGQGFFQRGRRRAVELGRGGEACSERRVQLGREDSCDHITAIPNKTYGSHTLNFPSHPPVKTILSSTTARQLIASSDFPSTLS